MKYLPGFMAMVGLQIAFAADTPYRLVPAWDYPLLGTGIAASGYGFYQEWQASQRTLDPNRFSQGDIPAFDRWAIGYYSQPLSTLSGALVVLQGLSPCLITAVDVHGGGESWSGAWTDLVVYGEVVTLASTLSLYSKDFRWHPRPLVFTDQAPESERTSGDARSSFFSEHATGAFAAAVFTAYSFGLRYPDSKWTPWVWTGSLGVAATVGVLRVASGKHFPSDVLAAAAAGSLAGFLVPYFHREHRVVSGASQLGVQPSLAERWWANTQCSVVPGPDAASPMLLLQWRI